MKWTPTNSRNWPSSTTSSRSTYRAGLRTTKIDVAVQLELRALVGVDRVLDGEGMEVELLDDLGELLLGRLVEPEPHEAAVVLARRQGARQVADLTGAPALAVDPTVDDHRPSMPAWDVTPRCAHTAGRSERDSDAVCDLTPLGTSQLHGCAPRRARAKGALDERQHG